MKHIMKLQPEFYYYMKDGTKEIEIRLNDLKRQKIKIGDTIIFTKEPDNIESFKTRVVDLLRYDSFAEMFNTIDISLLADKTYTKEKLIKELEKYYSKEKEEEYGVLGIKIIKEQYDMKMIVKTHVGSY